MDRDMIRTASRRILDSRLRIINHSPFFGRLLLRLNLKFADCETACTDMKNLIIDPAFLNSISDSELDIVLLHETLHCVLGHCVRVQEKNLLIFNIACDIVVNSFVLEITGKKELLIDGEKLIHTVPDGSEGSLYSVEEVYKMLINGTDTDELAHRCVIIDSHDTWTSVEPKNIEEWHKYICDAVKGGVEMQWGIPPSLRRYVADIIRDSRVDWRQILHELIQFDLSDFIFEQPDKRFQGDIILPSFAENIWGESIKKLWIFADTSASIDDETLAVALDEIRNAFSQIDNIEGKLFFFDTDVSEPKDFESFDDIIKAEPVGGGGTRFSAIFESMTELDEDELPVMIIVLTDGYSLFPSENAARGVPVVWVIIRTDVEPPWGETIHVD